jgi:rRNA maturation endonuclease Nob1
MNWNLFCWKCGVNFISEDMFGACPICDGKVIGVTKERSDEKEEK